MSNSLVTFVNLAFVPAGLVVIMFSLGLTLRPGDFVVVWRQRRLVLTGLFGQLVLMPLLALAVGIAFALPPELALAVFILGICPAGTTSNALTYVGGGNVALAVVLTALSSLITVFSIPLLLQWALPHFLPSGHVPDVPVLQTMAQLGRITLLPISVGMAVRGARPAWAERLGRWLKPTSLIVLIGVIAVSLLLSFEMVMRNFVRVAPALWCLNAAAMACGLLLARLVRAGWRDRMTLAIEVGVHNATMAIFITLQVLGDLPVAVTQNIYGVVMVINAGILIRWLRRRREGEGLNTG
ncbi:MAG: sodium transporter [Alphaproteobacteria bacterium]|nr:sodium transporter [Alphaproteobacteria bacterium]